MTATTIRPRRTSTKDVLFVCAVVGFALLCLLGVAGLTMSLTGASRTVDGPRLAPPSWRYPLGTDSIGRSLLPRLLEGIGVTFLLSIVAVAITAVLSTVAGVVAGYTGGATKEVVMRLADILYAFPSIVLAILIAAVIGPGQTATISAIVLVTAPLMIRMIAAQTASLKPREYFVSARISGVRPSKIMIRHVAPGIAGTLLIQGTYALSVGILLEGGLSFLGQGVQLPQASLGSLVQNGAAYMASAPWLLFAPAIVLVVSILSVTIIGDSLRDRLDPRQVNTLT